LIKLYGERIKEIPNFRFIVQLLERLNNCTQNKYKNTIDWCQKVINGIKIN